MSQPPIIQETEAYKQGMKNRLEVMGKAVRRTHQQHWHLSELGPTWCLVCGSLSRQELLPICLTWAARRHRVCVAQCLVPTRPGQKAEEPYLPDLANHLGQACWAGWSCSRCDQQRSHRNWDPVSLSNIGAESISWPSFKGGHASSHGLCWSSYWAWRFPSCRWGIEGFVGGRSKS